MQISGTATGHQVLDPPESLGNFPEQDTPSTDAIPTASGYGHLSAYDIHSNNDIKASSPPVLII